MTSQLIIQCWRGWPNCSTHCVLQYVIMCVKQCVEGVYQTNIHFFNNKLSVQGVLKIAIIRGTVHCCFAVYTSVNSNWVHPPDNPRGSAQKSCKNAQRILRLLLSKRLHTFLPFRKYSSMECQKAREAKWTNRQYFNV